MMMMNMIMMTCLIAIPLLVLAAGAVMITTNKPRKINRTYTFPQTQNNNMMKKVSNQTELSYSMLDKIHGLSIQVGELYAKLYRDQPNTDAVDHALDAFRAIRRMLPTEITPEGLERHVGHSSASEATQGLTL